MSSNTLSSLRNHPVRTLRALEDGCRKLVVCNGPTPFLVWQTLLVLSTATLGYNLSSHTLELL